VDIAAIFTGIAAILTAAGGMMLVVREFRRRDRRGYQFEIDELNEELHLLREDFSDFRRWAFTMHERAVDAGADVTSPPPPRPLAPVDPDGVRMGRRALRHFRRADDGNGGRSDNP
jgi:hypothetical protein